MLIERIDGTCKTVTDYKADFDVLKSKGGSTIVRTYSVIDINVPAYRCEVAATILPAAQSKGVKVILGLWCVKNWLILFNLFYNLVT